MQWDGIVYGQYAIHLSDSVHDFEPISPLQASIDPRFGSLLIRAANYRERVSQQRLSPTTSNSIHSSSVATINSQAW
jgi:hypothetical protein